MIIGHGDIASVLKDRKGFIFFASGVSNSHETRRSEFKREEELLLIQNRKRHIVYFSSIQIFWNDNPYFKHKKRMERIIQKNFEKYTIVRIGNITWGENKHTLINYFKNRIIRNKPITIENSYRYIVELDEFQYWIDLIPDWKAEVTIPGKRMKIIDIVKEYGYA